MTYKNTCLLCESLIKGMKPSICGLCRSKWQSLEKPKEDWCHQFTKEGVRVRSHCEHKLEQEIR